MVRVCGLAFCYMILLGVAVLFLICWQVGSLAGGGILEISCNCNGSCMVLIVTSAFGLGYC